MDVMGMTITALKKNEFINLLRGDKKYMIEMHQYEPPGFTTDVSKILSCGIYQVFRQQQEIEMEFKNSLLKMLDESNFDVYMVCLYLMHQLFQEKHGSAPFELHKKDIIEKLHYEIIKRKKDIKNGITCPSGYKYTEAWEDLERFNRMCKQKFQIELF